jgi:hypothetical protein
MGSTLSPALLAGVTVSLVDLDIFPEVAVIVVAPISTEVAIPFDPAALLIVATDSADELQVTDVVMSLALLSE